MNWWQSAFHSPPPPSTTADDNYINNRTNGRMSDVASLFSRRRAVGSHDRHRIIDSRNLQHLTDDDDDDLTPSRSAASPQTLPVPELSVHLKRDSRREAAANQTIKYLLPSPEDATKKSNEKRGISDVNHIDLKNPPCIVSLDRFTEHKEPQFLQKWPQGRNLTLSTRDEHKNGESLSAPTTPVSNRGIFTPTNKTDLCSSNHFFPRNQAWLAPEPALAPPDMPPGVANHYQTVLDRSIHGCDGSPVHSPQKRTNIRSQMSSNSPLQKSLSAEIPMSRRDSNAQMTVGIVHPLPLPPGAAVPPPSSPPLITNKPDLIAKTPRHSQWQKGKLIGRGTFGSVYVGANRETGALCAMKEVEILPDDPKSVECIKQLQQEINVLSQLKHPNIVQYYGSEIVGDRFYIYLEYIHPGSINKYARDHCGGMTESIVRNFTRHIVSGLAYLHGTKTIHRDIKGANLLVDANGVVKLADFGMAKHLTGQVDLSLKGSPYWMAPELLLGEKQKDSCPDLALAVDIWSLGCTIIEMMNGKPPWSEYEGPAAMFKVIKETPPIPETMSSDGKDFLRCCFVRNPAERPTANMLLEHRFLKNSSQLDFPASNNRMVQNRRERLNHRPGSMSMPTDTSTAKGKLLNSVDMRMTNVSY
ncbi:mitogen-activated protein kinase kinase kinase 5-like [Cynara cardunculus var. scolymus]|uniref:mitogen-activated protein kinase kinase kinase 5-like n=1 Tax=Cynara cardunculus var. scolymus TaxID=59895 RepID=UPI000D62EB79|nr:mitogen-activated protein kinase kinase kinase 5-like [Cynara cardunculus var. scolymus]